MTTHATITRPVFPDQANHHGTLFGGEALSILASAGAIAATRRARRPVVLANSGSVDFVAPVPLGSIAESHAVVERVGRTSLAVRATLDTEDLLSGERQRACTAQFVFVAVDAQRAPTAVPAVAFTGVQWSVDEAQTQSVELVLPGSTNPSGAMFGGELMRLLDAIAFVAATRTARARLVTARSEQTNFLSPARQGELVSLRGSVVDRETRSLVVEVEALAEDPRKATSRPCTAARFKFARPRHPIDTKHSGSHTMR